MRDPQIEKQELEEQYYKLSGDRKPKLTCKSIDINCKPSPKPEKPKAWLNKRD